jgi:NADPH-dependent glutamate synthase beta subunit-like oxidoreductase
MHALKETVVEDQEVKEFIYDHLDEKLEQLGTEMPIPFAYCWICLRPNWEEKDADSFIAAMKSALDKAKSKPELKYSPILPTAKKVAVIGSGPAGLTAAWKLAREGIAVTIFESLPEMGGMLKIGIPLFRLPNDILDYEMGKITNMGVETRLNTALGRDFTLSSLKEEGFSAVFLAVGAHKDMKLGVAGEDHKDVISGVDFLRELNLGNKPNIGKNVIVIGGGNVAMDAAGSARRLGCDVTVIYRRTKAEMPANEWEVRHTEEEGVKIYELATQVEAVIEEGKLTGLKCLKNKLGDQDASGRRSPVAIANSEFVVPADCIIVAIGQKVDDESVIAGGVDKFNRWGTLDIDENTMQVVGVEGVFAGGDAIRGPATVVEAIADGNRAAKSIVEYLEELE